MGHLKFISVSVVPCGGLYLQFGARLAEPTDIALPCHESHFLSSHQEGRKARSVCNRIFIDVAARPQGGLHDSTTLPTPGHQFLLIEENQGNSRVN